MNPSLSKVITKYVSRYHPTDVYIKGYLFITDSLIRKLETFIDEITIAFDVPRDEAIKLVFSHMKDTSDKLVLINQLLVDDEHLNHFTVKELDDIRVKIVEDKFAFARAQSYENAAKYRDVEHILIAAIKRKEANNE